MARKQIGMVDAELVARVDEQAGILGQTRRVFVERALERALVLEIERPGATAAGDVRAALEAIAHEPPGLPMQRYVVPPAYVRALGKGYTEPRPKGSK